MLRALIALSQPGFATPPAWLAEGSVCEDESYELLVPIDSPPCQPRGVAPAD
jgi:hypothetical protein